MQPHEEILGSPRDTRAERPTGDGIDQLREILFGDVFHELERRIALSDAQHAARENDLKYEARRRVEIIESHLRKELDLLATRVEQEVSERGDSLRNLMREHRESLNALVLRVQKLEDAMGQTQRQLRHELLEQAKGFLDELENLRNEFSNTLERRLESVESELQVGAVSDESKT